MNNKMICHSQLALSPQETAAPNEKSFKVKRILEEPMRAEAGPEHLHFEAAFLCSSNSDQSSAVIKQGSSAAVNAGLVPLGDQSGRSKGSWPAGRPEAPGLNAVASPVI